MSAQRVVDQWPNGFDRSDGVVERSIPKVVVPHPEGNARNDPLRAREQGFSVFSVV
jgi:hypothetical protein